MLCEKCGQNRKNGDYYHFRYGNYLGKTATPTPGTVKKNYVIVGQEKAWICRFCYVIGILRSPFGLGTLAILFMIVVMFLGGEIKVSSDTGGVGTTITLFIMLAAFLCIPLFFHAQKYKKNTWTIFGDKQAMRARQQEFVDRGYDAFFTRSSK